MYVTTVRDYIASLGGELEIYANLPERPLSSTRSTSNREDGVEKVEPKKKR